jgi:hypothetical protein
MTIGSVFSIALGAQLAALPADDRTTVTNPLRGPNRSSAFDNVFDGHPSPSAEDASPPRSPPGLWRNPGTLRTPDGPATSGRGVVPSEPSPAAIAGAHDADQPPAAQPPRTWLQRMRDRRLAQLEKQAERLRELSQQDGQRPAGSRNSVNPNGRENPDLQIDLGMPLDAPEPANADPARSDAFAAPSGTHPVWSPDRPTQPAEMSPPELNPPADPPIDIQIEVPDDPEPPQPKPTIQARVRNWWSPTTR